MIGLLNVGSLLLGIIAWILPVVNLAGYKKNNRSNWVTLSILSVSACAISLSFQIFYHYHLVLIEDWSAMMDITGAVASAAAILLIVTILLNTLTLMVYRSRTIQ
ncbi:hypothetical protein [Robertmurraya andreesenii]|uniref:Cytochrome c oxidase subunit 4 n=1 Tax=Anoxybacillus andreesenii TaxID=1325932 RepID=A0ABT9V719_9BACL|nr:hypothetical protein [Robertmurraya andreesenii]MDQ0156722.1 cytochrome c oxidase subunit 4 [Robertmurraya andreesenii]